MIARGGPAQGVHDPLHVRGLALDGGTTRIAVAVCDLRMIDRAVVDRGKAIGVATGVRTSRRRPFAPFNPICRCCTAAV